MLCVSPFAVPSISVCSAPGLPSFTDFTAHQVENWTTTIMMTNSDDCLSDKVSRTLDAKQQISLPMCLTMGLMDKVGDIWQRDGVGAVWGVFFCFYCMCEALCATRIHTECYKLSLLLFT